MLNRLRATLNSAFLSAGRTLSRLGIPPIGWTLFALLFAFLSSLSYGARGSYGAPLGGLFILVSGSLDILDGAVARVSGKTSKSGAFLDSTLDRLGEVMVYLGIVFGGYSSPEWVIIAVSFSLLVSYTRAKGDALGADLSGVGIGERSERLLILAVFSLAGLVSYGVIIVGAVATLTFLQRVVSASEALSGRSRATMRSA